MDIELEAFGQELRNLRSQKFTELSSATVSGLISAQKICRQWSDFADICLKKAFEKCFNPQDYALLALGKLGAQELNLSSDVDIVIVSKSHPEGHSGLKKFMKLLGEITHQGFVFRLDFDLRPGGRMGSLIPTMDEFMDYYGNYGETWERLALLRLRPVAGSEAITKPVLEFRNKFCFRKHLDLGLFEDFKHLRFSIQTETRKVLPHEINLKLSSGGIRDVELFTQCLQIINGGKNHQIRTHSTDEALLLLTNLQLLPNHQGIFLREHYWNLRTLENFVQRNNQQTHILNELETFPHHLKPLVEGIRADMDKCHHIVKELIGENIPPLELDESIPEEILKKINEISLFSRNRQKDLAQRTQFVQVFAKDLKNSRGDWGQGFENLLSFLSSTKAKASFYVLLNRNPSLIEEMAWLFGHSPYLSQILCVRPELLDSYIFRSTDLKAETLEEFLEKTTETKLLSELINGSRFLKDKNIEELTEACSSVADKILLALSRELKKNYPSQVEILCLGKWGTRELGLKSDLDFIFVTPEAATEADIKFSRRLLSRLTEAHRGGAIYSVDMRLRPSGKAGPLVISKTDLQAYLQSEAEPWEKQIYLKARWLDQEVFSLADILSGFTLEDSDLATLEDIRTQLIRPGLDIKYAEGGLLDIELAAQTACLLQRLPCSSIAKSLTDLGWTELKKNYLQLRMYEQLGRLLSQSSSSKWTSNIAEQIAHLTQQESGAQVESSIQGLLSENLDFLRHRDPRRLSK